MFSQSVRTKCGFSSAKALGSISQMFVPWKVLQSVLPQLQQTYLKIGPPPSFLEAVFICFNFFVQSETFVFTLLGAVSSGVLVICFLFLLRDLFSKFFIIFLKSGSYLSNLLIYLREILNSGNCFSN